MAHTTVLLPTCNRLESLILTLSGLANQAHKDFDLIIADQSESPAAEAPVIRTLIRVIESFGAAVQWHYRYPSLGIAEQRHFLLNQAEGDFVLYLDDDVFMAPDVLGNLVRTLRQECCGFVGAFPSGMSFRRDVRKQQQQIEYWDGPVQAERVEPDSLEWERWQLHRAANLWHVGESLPSGEIRRYKIAWIASCVLYDRKKLLDVGGFSFWSRLPRFHSGEDVLVQNLLLRKWGGCGIVPSGTYHAELPSTVLNAAGKIDGHALELLSEMTDRFS